MESTMTVIHEMPRWLIFSLISSLLCICGSLCVPLMSTIFKGNQAGHNNGNTKLVNYGLSLSAGSMLTTSLYMMLPKIDRENRFGVFGGVLTGVFISLLLNYVVHVYASESLVHCAHGDGEENDEGNNHGHHHIHSHDHSHHHSHGHEHSHSMDVIHNDPITARNFTEVEEQGGEVTEPHQKHQVDVSYEINCQVSHHSHDCGHNLEAETDPLLPNTSNDNNDITLTVSKKKSVTMGKSLIDLLTKRHRNSIGECCSLGECTPTIEPDELHCSRPGLVSSHDILHPTSSHRSSKKNGDTNNLTTTATIDRCNSVKNDGTMNEADFEALQRTQQGIACVENIIGYDLENLSLYRKNFYSAKVKEDNSESNGETGYGSTSASMVSVETSTSSIDSHGHELDNNEQEYDQNVDSYDLENNLTYSQSHPRSSILIRHHSLQPSHAHHHHIETPFSKLLSIGMQTCIVLTLHKFPEGFIIFYTNKDDTPDSLGFSIFLSLTIHNFVEGFAMTLPLYAIFESKWLALVITAVLGGGSQPMGALIGYLIFRGKTGQDNSELQMDFLLSVTAGFLLVIGLQMFQTGIGFSDGHHHHQGEANEEMKKNHSSGTTCLKWCCAGVLLILASQVFK